MAVMQLPDVGAQRRNLAKLGITFEQKMWLVVRYQQSTCPICLEPLEYTGSHIDHFHGCANVANHHGNSAEQACVQCIRGALHQKCNGTVVYILERWPHLQNDLTRQYLARRPFMGK